MTQDHELKPCPFCGGHPDLCDYPPQVYCPKCDLLLENECKEAVIKAWNTRSSERRLSEDKVIRFLETYWSSDNYSNYDGINDKNLAQAIIQAYEENKLWMD